MFNQRGDIKIIVGLILGVVIVAGAYYLGVQKNQTVLPQEITPPATFNSSESSSPEATNSQPNALVEGKSETPSDWTVENSVTCNVGIPLPPKKEPYYIPENPKTPPAVDDEGGYWQYEEYKARMFMFNTTARAIFRHPEGGSGYVSGDVEVICSPNTSNYTTQTLMAKLEADLSNDEISIKSKTTANMWERSVNVVKFQGGLFDDSDHYIFATTKNIYLVRKITMSPNQTIKDTTEQIFNNLQFSLN